VQHSLSLALQPVTKTSCSPFRARALVDIAQSIAVRNMGRLQDPAAVQV